MKKENKSSKKTKTMETSSVPKRMQPLINALVDFVVGITASVVPDIDEGNIRQTMTDNQEELVNLVKSNMPVQKVAQLKKVKDPKAPKRGKSSYIYFCVDKRPAVNESNPDMSAKEIIKELGRVWREDTSDDEKDRYSKLSNDDKDRYVNEMKGYTPPPNVGNVIEKKAKRSGPKRGLTSYIFFCKDQRAILKEEDSNLSTKDVTSELGKRWKLLSEKDRKPYDKLAAKDKARYEKEKVSWVDPEGEALLVTKKVKSNKKATSSEKKSHTKRKKSGYILFCQEERPSIKDEHDDWTSQDVTKELGRRWKELSPDEQVSVNERASNEPDEPSSVKAPVNKNTTKGKKGKAKKPEPEPEPESEVDDLVDEDSD
jgi:hypothetical protein